MYTYAYQILEKLLLAQVPELREIDWYLNQDSTSDKNTWLFTAPSVFLEFIPVEGPRDHGHRIQSVITDINVHLLTENTKDKGSKIINKQQTDPIAHAKLMDKVYKVLQGFSARLSYLDAFTALAATDQDQRVMNSLSRNGITPPHRIRKTMIKSVQSFRCVVYDHAAGKLYTVPEPEPVLEVFVDLDVETESFEPIPDAPSAIIYDNITASQVQLFWTRVADVDGYVVEKDGVEVYEGDNTTVVLNSGITQNTTYAFRVKTLKGSKESEWRTISVTVPQFFNCATINNVVPFVGTSERQTALEPSIATVDKPFSWSRWVRVSNVTALENNIYFDNCVIPGGVSQQWGLFMIASGNTTISDRLRFLLCSDTSNANIIFIQSEHRIPKNRWVHVVVTYDGSETNTGFEMYIDGVKETNPTRTQVGTYTGCLNNAALRFIVGSDQSGRKGSFNVKDIVIEDRVWTQSDVNELYNNGILPDITELSFFDDIVAYYPLDSDFSCANNSSLNLTGTFQQSVRAIRPVKHLGYKKIEVTNSRYVAFGGIDRVGDIVNLRIRSGTTHLANGKIIKIPITISTETPTNPVDVITDGSFDLRGGSNGQVNNKIVFFSSRYNTSGNTFEDAMRYESTDGLVGSNFGAGSAMTENYLRFNFYGKVLFVNGVYVVPFFGHNGSGTWKLSLRESTDGTNWTDRDIFDGSNQYGECAIGYTDGIWLLLFRRESSPYGIYQSYSTDDRATWSLPELTNLSGATGAGNCDIEINSVGRVHITIMDRSGSTIKRSKNNSIHDVIANPLGYNTPVSVFQSYVTDSLGVLGYPNILHLGDEVYFEGFSAEQSSSRADYYFGIGKINEPL